VLVKIPKGFLTETLSSNIQINWVMQTAPLSSVGTIPLVKSAFLKLAVAVSRN
jgi:hypothetical protein